MRLQAIQLLQPRMPQQPLNPPRLKPLSLRPELLLLLTRAPANLPPLSPLRLPSHSPWPKRTPPAALLSTNPQQPPPMRRLNSPRLALRCRRCPRSSPNCLLPVEQAQTAVQSMAPLPLLTLLRLLRMLASNPLRLLSLPSRLLHLLLRRGSLSTNLPLLQANSSQASRTWQLLSTASFISNLTAVSWCLINVVPAQG
jgi:hypothetical protein